MRDFDFSGLRSDSQAAFKTSFADVVHRSRRRRRARATGVILAAAVVIAGTGVAGAELRPARGRVTGLPAPVTTPPFIPASQPSDAPTASRSGSMRAGDLTHLYLRYADCQPQGCEERVAATSDAGATWSTAPLPVPRDSVVQVYPLAARTLVAWWYQPDSDGQIVSHWLSSTDGAAHWRTVTVRTVTAFPAGWRVLDQPGDVDTVPILAADPVTGDIGQLSQPAPVFFGRATTGLPAAAGLWVAGSDWSDAGRSRGDTRQSSVLEVSHDGGRTWDRETFPEPMRTDGDGGPGAPVIATDDGRTAYALGNANGFLTVYRTTDGGKTWQRTDAHVQIKTESLYASLSADGTLTVQVGLQQSDHPAMYQSTDGGQTLHRVTIGPGAGAQPVDSGVTQSGWPNTSGAWLSRDGIAWTYVSPPKLP